MLRRKNQLLETALACVDRGIPVQSGRATHGGPAPEWLTQPADVIAVWQVANPPNFLISSGPTVAIWKLPSVDGAYGKRLYEQLRPGVWPPAMKLPDGDWITCTLPPDADLGPLATGVEYLTPGTPVMIPPSRLSSGRRMHWDGAKFPLHPLPTAEAVLSQVRLAECQRHELLHGRID